MKSIRETIKKIVRIFHSPAFYYQKSFSQEGEDIIINRLIQGKKNGFYVEVGCHHPFRFSNTYFFYQRGWRGICIDPLPNTVKLFNRFRPRDIAIEKGVSLFPGVMRYFLFNEPALNTFDEEIAKSRDGKNNCSIKNIAEIETIRLSSILLDNNAPREIDLLSVDVEGYDLQVLQSNDWEKFKPKLIIAETLEADMCTLDSDPLSGFLKEKGYKPYAKTGNSVIFCLEVL